MARVEIDEVVLAETPSGQVRAVSGASVQVNIRGGGAATVYAAETGPATLPNPLTTSHGRIDGWLDAGAYDLVVTYTIGGRTSTYTQPLSSSAGSGSANNPELVNSVAATGSTETLPDVTVATVHRLVLDANCTLTFPTAAAGKSFTVVLVQDATGGRTVTWPGTVAWGGGTTPVLTTTANKRDVFSFLCADGTNWLGFFAGQNL